MSNGELCNEILNDVLLKVQDLEKVVQDLINVPKAGKNSWTYEFWIIMNYFSVEYSGTILKTHPMHSTPLGLSIKWFNFLEQDEVYEGNEWRLEGGKSTINSTLHFTLQVFVIYFKMYEFYNL